MKKITKDHMIYSFKPDLEPVEKIYPGETVMFEANDAFNGQIESEQDTMEEVDFSKVNPATGPLYIEGAEKGDVLRIKILEISIPEKGVTVTAPDAGALGDMVEKPVTRIIDIEDDFCEFKGHRLPINPMIGVIGVATSEEEIPTGTPDSHGGNMDTKDISEGSTLYLPVNQKGGLLALGDCHAVMGDGEVSVSSCEIRSDVMLKVDLIKDGNIDWPIVETEDSYMIITSCDTTDDALQEATEQAVEFLSEGLGTDWHDAYLFASLAVDLKISQIVDPKKTVRASIPKRYLPLESIIKN